MQSGTLWTISTVASCTGRPQLQAADWLFVLLPSSSLEASRRKVADPVLVNIKLLEGKARYAGLLLAPAEGFWHSAKALLAFGQSLFGLRP
jgi:hypothetical protein